MKPFKIGQVCETKWHKDCRIMDGYKLGNTWRLLLIHKTSYGVKYYMEENLDKVKFIL